MNIPIYRAKKIISDEFVEGYFDPTLFGGAIHTTNGSHIIVDPLTLKMSINGKDWFSISELSNELNNSEKTKRREAVENGHNYNATYYR